MKTAKFLFGVVFILSLSFNAAFLLHLFTAKTPSPPANTAEASLNQLNLDLSEEQLKQMEPLRQKLHQENETIKKEMFQCQEKLLAALDSDPPDKAVINTCIENINTLQKKIQQNTIEEIILVRKVMNPEQCNCLMKGLGAAMQQTAAPCNCSHCQSAKK